MEETKLSKIVQIAKNSNVLLDMDFEDIPQADYLYNTKFNVSEPPVAVDTKQELIKLHSMSFLQHLT